MENALAVLARFSSRKFRDPWPEEEALKELSELCRASGAKVLEEVVVRREEPVPATFLGTGKVEELKVRGQEIRADLAVFGEDLSPTQQRNLEEAIGLKIIDRTQLILDIFSRRARSREGKVQVELAQLEYLLPRLAGKGTLLSRLGGGIGTRGPGEQKLEMDRRRIRLRISRLKEELSDLRRRRALARGKRVEEEVPTAALIGYTNAGKTTLLNALTQAGASARDQLFTTLDPLSRRLLLPSHQPVLITDTVGFLHRLPHHLIEAFQATLEEATQAHLLLHLCDASSPLLEEQSDAVEEVLELLGSVGKKRLLVMNKIDRLDSFRLAALQRQFPEALFISALTGGGVPTLLDRLDSVFSHHMLFARVLLPPAAHRWVKPIYGQGHVISRRPAGEELELECRLPERLYGQLQKAGLILPS
ncbi:MAG: GTPase HflX [Candidatus Omnitrophica bacterium]|nr:GTPase HflX [Candidatus Omnitrophota bacterium]